jgi:hypothetical protein
MLEKMSHRKEEHGREMRRCLGKTQADEGAWYYATHKKVGTSKEEDICFHLYPFKSDGIIAFT